MAERDKTTIFVSGEMSERTCRSDISLDRDKYKLHCELKDCISYLYGNVGLILELKNIMRYLKKGFVITLLSVFLFCASARAMDFLGVDLCGSNADAVGIALEEKGYKYIGASESAWQFAGLFAGYDAQISLYVQDGQEDDQKEVGMMFLSVKHQPWENIEHLRAQILQKLVAKYPDFKHEEKPEMDGEICHHFLGPSEMVIVDVVPEDRADLWELVLMFGCNVVYDN